MVCVSREDGPQSPLTPLGGFPREEGVPNQISPLHPHFPERSAAMANHMKAGPSPPGRKLCRSGLVVTAALLFLFVGMWLYVFSTGLVPGLYLGLGGVLSFLLCAGVFFLTWDVSHRIRARGRVHLGGHFSGGLFGGKPCPVEGGPHRAANLRYGSGAFHSGLLCGAGFHI